MRERSWRHCRGGVHGASWPRFSTPPTNNDTISWYKVEDASYVLAPTPDPMLDAQNDDPTQAWYSSKATIQPW